MSLLLDLVGLAGIILGLALITGLWASKLEHRLIQNQMSGQIIEIAPIKVGGRLLYRLWVIDNFGDELVVFSEPFEKDDGPDIGEYIWWREDRIYYDSDRLFLKKVGNSARAPTA